MTRLEQQLRYMVFGERVRRVPRRRKLRRGPPRSPVYRSFVRQHPCCVCGKWGAEAAHTGRDGGAGLKATDFSCVPLCVECHTTGRYAYHRIGRKAFEIRFQVNFDLIAEELYTAWTAIGYSRTITFDNKRQGFIPMEHGDMTEGL